MARERSERAGAYFQANDLLVLTKILSCLGHGLACLLSAPILDLCEQAKAQNGLLSDSAYSNHVVRISDTIAVKYGYGVSPGEAATQRYAYQHLNQRVVRVPRVYRYFQDKTEPSWPKGYLFMEYIPGKSLEDLDLLPDDISERLAAIVSELASGYLWGDNGTGETFQSTDDMNRWLNKRLKLINKEIDLRPYPLVLCHLDLCRRNIKLMEDNSICLLDWGHAGFFPRFFEVAAVSCMNDNAAYGKSLYNAITKETKLAGDEQECVRLLLKARAASLRYI
ncbi:hypothetical protein MaudMau93_000331, partial [Microsporum audouinii]